MAGSLLITWPVFIWKSNFIDMIRRRSLRTRAIKMLVLDEADEMLNKGMDNEFSRIGMYFMYFH